MSRPGSRRRTATLLGGAALALLAGVPAQAENAKLVQGDDPYYRQAEEAMRRIMTQQRNTNQAKNVILVVGDGMGFSTVTAARIFEGQQRGVDGESNVLAWEAFPYLAASKTYSADAQITDSAPSAVAMTTGVKTINDLMGLNHTARLNNCEDQKTKAVTTLWEMAESIGLSAGFVTTATVTHATPGATYSHIANRDWESDAAMTPEALAAGCADIARQLVEMRYGDGFEVAMGGGRANFLPSTADDPEDKGKKGKRKDGRDLTQAWLQRYGDRGAYVWNKEQFDRLDPAKVDHVLALFEMSHMEYDFDRPKDTAGEPSLAEMTEKAIDILARNPEGYVLLVEGGRVDHGSHAGNAFRTLSDAVALNEAVKTILRKVNLDETIVVVTGDHSHTLTIAGYAKRGNPILGISIGVDGQPIMALDGKPYTTLSFANGPGSKEPIAPPAAAAAANPQQPAAAAAASPQQPATAAAPSPQQMTPVTANEPPPQTGATKPPPTDTATAPAPVTVRPRPTITMEEATDPDYIQQALVPMTSETHGGEDLGIYAIGPWAHLFQGTVEENYTFHVLNFASKIGERAQALAEGQAPPVKKAQGN